MCCGGLWHAVGGNGQRRERRANAVQTGDGATGVAMQNRSPRSAVRGRRRAESCSDGIAAGVGHEDGSRGEERRARLEAAKERSMALAQTGASRVGRKSARNACCAITWHFQRAAGRNQRCTRPRQANWASQRSRGQKQRWAESVCRVHGEAASQ